MRYFVHLDANDRAGTYEPSSDRQVNTTTPSTDHNVYQLAEPIEEDYANASAIVRYNNVSLIIG